MEGSPKELDQPLQVMKATFSDPYMKGNADYDLRLELPNSKRLIPIEPKGAPLEHINDGVGYRRNESRQDG